MTDWIPHDGGPCPVHPETVAEMQFEYGGLSGNYTAKNVEWEHVIAYRVIRKARVRVKAGRRVRDWTWEELVERSKRVYEALTPEQQADMWQAHRESFVRGNMPTGDPRFD